MKGSRGITPNDNWFPEILVGNWPLKVEDSASKSAKVKGDLSTRLLLLSDMDDISNLKEYEHFAKMTQYSISSIQHAYVFSYKAKKMKKRPYQANVEVGWVPPATQRIRRKVQEVKGAHHCHQNGSTESWSLRQSYERKSHWSKEETGRSFSQQKARNQAGRHPSLWGVETSYERGIQKEN